MKDVQHELSVVKDAITKHTVSNLNAHLQSEDISKSKSIADIYAFVRPLLLFVSAFLSFHPDWAKAIKALVAALDIEYPEAMTAAEEENQDVDDDNQEDGSTSTPPKGKGGAKKNTPAKGRK